MGLRDWLTAVTHSRAGPATNPRSAVAECSMGPNSSRQAVLLAVLVSLAVVAACADAVSGAPAFSDVTTGAGVGFLHHESTNQTLPFGAGVVVLDFNDDGLHDIYVPDSAGANVLYRNNGNGTFTDVASAAGVADPLGNGNGGCAADYDNDGDQDLFLTNYGPSRLYRNSGDQTFEDFTAEAGLHSPDVSLRSTGCAWGDYDRDGLLDLAIVRHVHEFSPTMFKDGDFAEGARTLALYHNNGDGTFTNANPPGRRYRRSGHQRRGPAHRRCPGRWISSPDGSTSTTTGTPTYTSSMTSARTSVPTSSGRMTAASSISPTYLAREWLSLEWALRWQTTTSTASLTCTLRISGRTSCCETTATA